MDDMEMASLPNTVELYSDIFESSEYIKLIKQEYVLEG
jgi:hypothetical protein